MINIIDVIYKDTELFNDLIINDKSQVPSVTKTNFLFVKYGDFHKFDFISIVSND